MRWPLITRKRHEQVITALAKLLYPDGVPLEFQLLLGVGIPPGQPEPVKAKAAAEEELEPASDEKLYREIKNADQGFRAKLQALRRTRPSQVGPAIAEEMRKRKLRAAQLANPAKQIFASAREQVR